MDQVEVLAAQFFAAVSREWGHFTTDVTAFVDSVFIYFIYLYLYLFLNNFIVG